MGFSFTWSNSQIWPWSTEWSRAKTSRVLPREHTSHSKHCTSHSEHRLPTTQEKTLHMDITRWSTPKSNWLYSLHQRWRSSIQSAKTRLGADCSSDHELLIAKFRLKLKKAGETTRPFRYDLNQIPYDYTMEVTNRFQGLDLIDRVSAWRTIDRGSWHCTGGSDQDHPQEKRMQKGKWLSEETFQMAEKRREAKGKGEKETQSSESAEFWICRVLKNSKER